MNERMTKRDTDGQAMMDCEKCKADWTGKHGKPMDDCTALYCRNRLKDRLAAYEDTHMMPSDVTSMRMDMAIIAALFNGVDVDRMKELAEADKNGCVIIVPCKVGDTVYFALLGKIIEKQVCISNGAMLSSAPTTQKPTRGETCGRGANGRRRAMSNDPFKWSTPPRGGSHVNSPCIEHDNVNHPAHYTAGGIECIDAIAAALTCQKDPMQAWLTGQVLKYIWRWPLKNGKEDLRKARFYLDRLINSAGDD